MKLFWIGLIVAPIVWYIFLKTIWFIFVKQWKAIKNWYWGLPIIQWPAMMLIVIGTKVIHKKYCKTMRYENRLWYSPMVEQFKIEN